MEEKINNKMDKKTAREWCEATKSLKVYQNEEQKKIIRFKVCSNCVWSNKVDATKIVCPFSKCLKGLKIYE